jgi:hypothetical protein
MYLTNETIEKNAQKLIFSYFQLLEMCQPELDMEAGHV